MEGKEWDVTNLNHKLYSGITTNCAKDNELANTLLPHIR